MCLAILTFSFDPFSVKCLKIKLIMIWEVDHAVMIPFILRRFYSLNKESLDQILAWQNHLQINLRFITLTVTVLLCAVHTENVVHAINLQFIMPRKHLFNLGINGLMILE